MALFVKKKAIFEKKWRKNRQSEIGPFWLILKLMDGPLSFFDIYGWPPSFLKLMDGPFGRKKAIFEEKRRKNQLSETGPFRLILKLVDGPLSFF